MAGIVDTQNKQLSIFLFKLCFAYKAASPLSYIQIQVYLDGDSKTAKNVFISVTTIADKQWHYLCADMYQGFLKQNSYSSSVYPKTRLTLLGVIKFLYT